MMTSFQRYIEAKGLKRFLERVSRLRKLVLAMDKSVMATVRSYSHPPSVVHASMRALFLLLGHSLSETKVKATNQVYD